jgi:hypothetical protein
MSIARHVVLLGSEAGDFIRLSFGRVFLDDPPAYRGVTTRVSFRLGGFRGSYGATLYATEIKRLLEELEAAHQSLTGAAHFKTLEGQLEFTLTMRPTGQVEFNGTLEDEAGTGNRLCFATGLDQTHLGCALTDLRRLVRDKF